MLHAALAGRYDVERALGRGGMATVRLARDVRHHRPVAVTLPRPEIADASTTEWFTREIDTIARLQRPVRLGERRRAPTRAHARGVIHRDVKPENILLQGGHALVAMLGVIAMYDVSPDGARFVVVAGHERANRLAVALDAVSGRQ